MGLGSSWGTREELLHPRGKDGRFITKGKMAKSIADALTRVLDAFSPRTFQSDQQAAQYLQNRAPQGRPITTAAGKARFVSDFDNVQEDLRDGVIDNPETKKFVDMMDGSAIDLPEGLILTRITSPAAFGLTAQTMEDPENGIYRLQGTLVSERGYQPTTVGTPLSNGGPGRIRMVYAAPAGTRAIMPSQDANDREVVLDRDQDLRVSKIDPDGLGGYTMYVVAVPREHSTPTPPPIGGHTGSSFKPEERAANIESLRVAQSVRAKAVGDQQMLQEQQGVPRGPLPGNIEPTPGMGAVPGEHPQSGQPSPGPAPNAAPPSPDLPPRQEAVQTESAGARTPRSAPAAPAPAPVQEQQPTPAAPTAPTPQAPAAPAAPEAPAAPGEVPAAPDTSLNGPDTFRDAIDDLETPTKGPQRAAFNNAYIGITGTGGRAPRFPKDVLRELRSDIDQNDRAEIQTAELRDNNDKLKKLAARIEEHFGIPPREAPPTKKAARKAATPKLDENGEPIKPAPRKRAPAKLPEVATEAKQELQPDNPIGVYEIPGGDGTVLRRVQGGVDDGTLSDAQAEKQLRQAGKYFRESAQTIRNGSGHSPDQGEAAAKRVEGVALKYDQAADAISAKNLATKAAKKAAKKTTPRATTDESGEPILRGSALDAALREAGLSTRGLADEKRARLAEHRASGGAPAAPVKKVAKAAVPAKKAAPAAEAASSGPDADELRFRADLLEEHLTDSDNPEQEDDADRAEIRRLRTEADELDAAAANAPAPAPAAKKVAKKAAGRLPDDVKPGDFVQTPDGERRVGSVATGPNGQWRVFDDSGKEILNSAEAGDRIPARRPTADEAKAARAEARQAATDAAGSPDDQLPSVDGVGTQLREATALRGKALDQALRDAGLPTNGLVAEKRQRLADHQAGGPAPTPAKAAPAKKVTPETRRAELKSAPAKAAMAEVKKNEDGITRSLSRRVVKDARLDVESGKLTPEEGAAKIEGQVRANRTDIEMGDRVLQQLVDDKPVGDRTAAEQRKIDSLRDDLARDRDDAIELEAAAERLRKVGAAPATTPEHPVLQTPEAQAATSLPDAVRSAEPLNLERARRFDQAFEGRFEDFMTEGAPGEQIIQIQTGLSDGLLAPEDAIKRIENEIAFNRDTVTGLQTRIRAAIPGSDDFRSLVAQRRELEDGIKAQERLSGFLRMHFNEEPAALPEEVERHITGEDIHNLLEKGTPADVAEFKRLVKEESGMDLEGSTMREAFQDGIRQAIKRDRPAKKVAAKKAPAKKAAKVAPEPAEGAPAVGNLAVGLDSVPEAYRADLQAKMNDPKKSLPAIGRELQISMAAPDAPGVRAAIMQATPEADRDAAWEAEHTRLLREHDALEGMAQRLLKSRRSRAAAPKTDPGVLTPAEETRATRVADDVGLDPATVSKAMATKKAAAAKPTPNDEGVLDLLSAARSMEEAEQVLRDGRHTAEDLRRIARAAGAPSGSGLRKDQLINRIAFETAGKRLAPSREQLLNEGLDATPDAAAGRRKLQAMTTSELRTVAKERGVTLGSRDRKPEMVEKIAAATVDRPTVTPAPSPLAPAKAAVPRAGERPVPRANFGFPFDRFRTPDIAGALGRSQGDDTLKIPNGGADQGLLHLDSEIGQLWSDLAADPRASNSELNNIVDLGHAVGAGHVAVSEAAHELQSMMQSVENPAVVARIAEAVRGMSAPPVNLEGLPDNIPPRVRAWLERVAGNPMFRQTNIRGQGNRESYFDQAREAIERVARQATEGRGGSMHDMSRFFDTQHLHESIDGVYADNRDRGATFHPPNFVEENGRQVRNPEYAELQNWFRTGQLSAPAARPEPNPDEFPLPPGSPKPVKKAAAAVAPATGGVTELLDSAGTMTIPELRTAAEALGVTGASDMRKNEIIAALEALEGGS